MRVRREDDEEKEVRGLLNEILDAIDEMFEELECIKISLEYMRRDVHDDFMDDFHKENY